MKIKQITETTTSGSIATVDTALGGTQSRGNPSIYGGKKAGSLFKGKKTKAPYANSINESAELSEAHLEEDDVIVVPGQGRSRKNGLVLHGQSRLDHEVEMARSDLFQAAKNAKQVYSMIKDVGEDQGLDGWVQEKIIKANDYLNTVREYLEGKQTQSVSEGSQQVDSLVTDALKIMRGPEVKDAIRALTAVLGNREYNSRRGFYNFYIKQIIDMYGQEGVAEGSTGDKSFDNMMKGITKGTKKQATVDRKEQKKQTQEKARDAFGNMFGGGNPANNLKIKEQGVAEGEENKYGSQENWDSLRKDIRSQYPYKKGTTVTVPHKGKLVNGKIIRYEVGGGGYSPAYVVDIGEYESIMVEPNKVRQGVAEAKADPTGSWVVYNGSKLKKFKTREGAKAYAEKNGGTVASSEYYHDKIQKQGVAEGIENNPVANEIINFIMKHRPDLLKYGADRVGDAIDRIASRAGNIGHINSDNIGKLIKQVEYYVTSNNNDMYEGKRNLKCVCKTHGTLQCPVHTPKDIDVLENNKNKKA